MKHITPAWIIALCQDLQRTENMWAIDGEAMLATLLAEDYIPYFQYLAPYTHCDEGGEG